MEPVQLSFPPFFAWFSTNEKLEIVGMIEGAGGALTVIEYVAVADELELVPVIVYMTADAAAVGVPEITPVAVLKLSPFPIDGEIE